MFDKKKAKDQGGRGHDPKKDKSRMEDFSESVAVPLHLSLPLYIVGIYLLLVGVFAVFGWGVFQFLADPEGRAFVTSLKKEFGPLDNMRNVRWKMYIPGSVFSNAWIFGVKTLAAGIFLVVLNRVGGTLWAKKRVEKTIESRKR